MAKATSSSRRISGNQRSSLRDDASLIFQSSNLGTKQIVRMVDEGLDDFSATKDGVCLSLIMLSKFFAITETLKTIESPSYRVEPGQITKTRKFHKQLKEELGDVVYIYKKLKDNPKGLNQNLLDAYQREYPDARLLLEQMDHYSPQSQETNLRFSSKPKQRGSRG